MLLSLLGSAATATSIGHLQVQELDANMHRSDPYTGMPNQETRVNLLDHALPYLLLGAILADVMDWLVLRRRLPKPFVPAGVPRWRSFRGLAIGGILLSSLLVLMGVLAPVVFGTIWTAYAWVIAATAIRQRHIALRQEARQ